MRLRAFFYLILSAITPVLANAQLASAPLHASLFIEESDSGVSAKIGDLGFSGQGYGLVTSSEPPSSTLPALMPDLAVPSSATRADLSDAAEAWVSNNVAALSNRLSSYAQQYGLSSIWYTYQKSFTVQTSTGPAALKLSWSLFQDGAGRPSYGAPRVEPAGASAARVLQVRYREKTLAAGMEGYNYPSGGLLQWQLLDATFSPIPGAAGVLDTGGAFDSSSDTSDSAEILYCLLDSSHAGCPTVAQDVRRLIGSSGASLALLDYTYAPEPRYQRRADVYCPTGTSDCFAPVTAYRFTSRRVDYSNCGDNATFFNTGEYSNEMEAITDRYVVDPDDLSADLLQRITESLPADVHPISTSKELTGAEIAALTAMPTAVIDPHTKDVIKDAGLLPGVVVQLENIVHGDIYCPPVTASVSPAIHNVETIGVFSVYASGGRGPYTYYWYPVTDLAGGTIYISNPTGASTSISRTGPTLGEAGGVVGYVDVRVTDSRGTQATARVTLTINPDLPLTVEIDPDRSQWNSRYGTYGIAANCTGQDSLCTASTQPAPIIVKGGSGSYTATWTLLAGRAAQPTNPTSYTTTFSRQGEQGEIDGLYEVSVTDGRSSKSTQLAVTTQHGCTTTPQLNTPVVSTVSASHVNTLTVIVPVGYCERTVPGYTFEFWTDYSGGGFSRVGVLAPNSWNPSQIWQDSRTFTSATVMVRKCKDGQCSPFTEQIRIKRPCGAYFWCTNPQKYGGVGGGPWIP